MNFVFCKKSNVIFFKQSNYNIQRITLFNDTKQYDLFRTSSSLVKDHMSYSI